MKIDLKDYIENNEDLWTMTNFKDAEKVLNNFLDWHKEAISYSQCCKSDSEQLFCDCYIKYPRGDGDCRRCGLPAKP